MENAERLGSQKISKLLFEFSLPAIVGMLVSAMYNVIDRMFIGNSSSGALGIAGITIGFPIMIIQFSFSVLIGLGATSLISIRLGQGKREDAQKIVGNAVVLLAVISVLFMVVTYTFLDPVLIAFGASREVLPFAHDYIWVILLGTPVQMYGFGLNSMMRGEGKPVVAMMTMLVGTILNAIFCPVFIYGFHWGIKGAALATVLAQVCSTSFIAYHFIWGKSSLRIRLKYMKIDPRLVGEILAIGAAPFAMQLAQSVLTAILNFSLAEYGGDVAISAMGIVNSLSTLIIMPVVGINQGSQPIIGYNYGAKNYGRCLTALRYAVIAASCIAVAGFIMINVIPSQLIWIFSPGDKALIAFGSRALTTFMFCLPLIGMQIVGSGYFQAVGKPKQSMLLNLSRQVIILIPLLLILPHFFKVNGVLYAGPISDAAASVITAICLFFEIKAMRRLEKDLLADGVASVGTQTANETA